MNWHRLVELLFGALLGVSLAADRGNGLERAKRPPALRERTARIRAGGFSHAGPSQLRVSFQEAQEIRGLISSLDTSNNDIFLRNSHALVEKGKRAVPFVISALMSNPNPNVRYQVARVLSQIRDDRGIDALFQASQLDPDDGVRMVAKVSLDALIELLNTHQLGDRVTRDYKRFDRRSVFALRNRLKNEGDASVRERAARALGEYGDERDLDVLFDAVKGDSVPEVRLEAARAIARIAYPILLGGEYAVTFYGTLAYGPDSFRERIVRALINLIREEPDASVRLEIVKGLTKLVFPTFLIGEEGFGPLLSLRARSREVVLRVRNCLLYLLRDDESRLVRKEAAASLSKLFAALFDRGDRLSNEEVRRSLLVQKRVYYFYPYFPGRIGYFYRRTFNYFPSRAEHLLKPVRDALLNAYSTDFDAEVRKEAILGLSLLGRKSDSKIILDHLRVERSPDVWLASIQALGQLGGESAAEALFNIYRKPSNDPELRKAAALSIGTIGDRAVLRNLALCVATESDREVKLAILESLGHHADDQTAAVLTSACRDRDPDVRVAAATAAGSNFTDETVLILKDLLKNDPDENVRAASCTSLSKTMREEAADLLIGALHDPSAVVRKTAAVELGIHKVRNGTDSLASVLLNDPEASGRAEAATSLGNIGGEKSVQPLISAIIRDSDALVREQALQALLKTDEPRSAIVAILAVLPKLAAENPNAYQVLNDALARLEQQAHGRRVAEK